MAEPRPLDVVEEALAGFVERLHTPATYEQYVDGLRVALALLRKVRAESPESSDAVLCDLVCAVLGEDVDEWPGPDLHANARHAEAVARSLAGSEARVERAWLGQIWEDDVWCDDYVTFDAFERDEWEEQEADVRTIPGMEDHRWRVVPLYTPAAPTAEPSTEDPS